MAEYGPAVMITLLALFLAVAIGISIDASGLARELIEATGSGVSSFHPYHINACGWMGGGAHLEPGYTCG
jgi:hypothetical protein